MNYVWIGHDEAGHLRGGSAGSPEECQANAQDEDCFVSWIGPAGILDSVVDGFKDRVLARWRKALDKNKEERDETV